MAIIYTSGSLLAEEEVLEWLIEQVETEEIEEVTDEMLEKLIERSENLAVLFCKKMCIQKIIQFSKFFVNR